MTEIFNFLSFGKSRKRKRVMEVFKKFWYGNFKLFFNINAYSNIEHMVTILYQLEILYGAKSLFLQKKFIQFTIFLQLTILSEQCSYCNIFKKIFVTPGNFYIVTSGDLYQKIQTQYFLDPEALIYNKGLFPNPQVLQLRVVGGNRIQILGFGVRELKTQQKCRIIQGIENNII